MSSQVVPYQPAVDNYGSRSLTAADIRAQVNLIKDVMIEVMQDGTHYGKIPGTNGKSLYKAGAEKLMATFRLAARPRVDDLSSNGEIHYRVFLGLETASGSFVGEGVGECSSSEDKYAWRAAVCDEEWEETPENRRRVKYSKGYQGSKFEKKKQVRTNPADVSNTILKMAKKRAQVDAVITATAASDIFTQDIEDLPEEIAAELTGKAPASAATSAPAKPERQPYPAADFEANLPKWRQLITEGKKSADDLIAMLQTKALFTPEQLLAIRAPAPDAEVKPNAEPPTSVPNEYWPDDSQPSEDLK